MNILEQAKQRLAAKNLLDGAFSDERIQSSDKRIINGTSDVNQLVPFKYEWAWQKYLDGCSNHWMPQEVSMQKDIQQWHGNDLTEDEKHIVFTALGFFSTADTLVANNLVLAIYARITSPEHRQYLLRQAFEEAIHCYVDGTEILTERGFVDFRELKTGIRVAQWHDNGDITYVIPDEILHDKYVGKVVEFKSNNGSLHKVVTPQHRCVAIDPRDKNKVKIKLAEDFYPHNYQIPVTGRLVNDGIKFSNKDALRVAYQADGSLCNPKSIGKGAINGCNFVRFTLKKQRKIDRLLMIVNSLGLRHTVSSAKKSGVTIYVWIPLEWDFDKEFDWIDFSEINSNWAFDFISEIANWDGCKRKNGTIIYTNTNKQAIDFVQTVAHLTGLRTGIYKTKVVSGKSQSWQLCIHSHKTYVSGRVVNRSELDYDGYVHCVGVPTGMIITRYNGSVVVSGNTHAYQYCIESLGMDESEVFNQYREVPEMAAKMAWAAKHTEKLSDPNCTDAEFLENMISFYVVVEGIFFYCGFPTVLALGRRNKMSGVAEQFQYILRDESMHLNFGIDTINQIISENPHLWTKEMQEKATDSIIEGLSLEMDFTRLMLPNGVIGMNQEMINDYLKYIVNRRLSQIGLPIISEWSHIENPLPWMSEMMDLRKEKNFFETRVTDYQVGGGLSWDD